MNDESEKFFEKQAHLSKCRAKALAFLRRAKYAGIPKDMIGPHVSQEEFEKILSPEYHSHNKKGGIKAFANFIFSSPEEIMSIPFILIDGGDEDARQKAGYAMLFRMITWDKFGLYINCSEIAHKMHSIMALHGLGRNDVVEELRTYDALFMGECDPTSFRVGFDAGEFIDDIIRNREEQRKPTILSFSQSLSSSISPENTNKNWGKCLADLSIKEYCNRKDHTLNPSGNILRIRVKIS